MVLIMKYLIAGLGNIGPDYANTRHNIGFTVLDSLAGLSEISWEDKRYAFKADYKYKARNFVLIKPTTYMNLSGKAINYWLQKEKIPVENLLVITDDLALPFGTIRIRMKGSDGGHNGLYSIASTLGTNHFSRLRFGIGDEFQKGTQVNYVLGEWSVKEKEALKERIDKVIEAIKCFGTLGIERTMNLYNNK
jgi:peptidyl-tRNA hydrolase, PTH1 family